MYSSETTKKGCGDEEPYRTEKDTETSFLIKAFSISNTQTLTASFAKHDRFEIYMCTKIKKSRHVSQFDNEAGLK